MSDDKAVCIDCGARLGAPMSASEEKEESSRLGMQLDELYESAYRIDSPRKSRAIGIISAVLTVFLIASLIIAQAKWHASEDENLSELRQEFEELISSGESGVFPSGSAWRDNIAPASRMYNTIAIVSLIGLPFSALAAVMFLAPSLEWRIKRWGLNLAYETAGEIRRSLISVKLLRGTMILSFAISVVCAAMAAAMFLAILI